jgi:beta-phosphoglucomutase-like phosphatase (HAD superfamily)
VERKVTMITTVLLDLDDTHLDIEELWTLAFSRLAAELGCDLRSDDSEKVVGHSLPAATRRLYDALGVEVPPERSTDRLQELVAKQLAHKPHPEPYLQAMRRLGVGPHECIAVEDSSAGARAAEAAGLFVVVVPSVTPVLASRQRHIVSSLSPNTVSRLGPGTDAVQVAEDGPHVAVRGGRWRCSHGSASTTRNR